MNNNVLERLNTRFKDQFNLQAVLQYKNEVQAEQKKMEEMLFNSDGEISQRISNALTKVENQKSMLNDILVDLEKLQTDINEHDTKVEDVKTVTEDYIQKIGLLERSQSYLSTLSRIESISQSIENGLKERGGRSVTEYSQLCTLAELLQTSSCSNLIKYLTDIITYWHSVLKDQYTKDFEEVLKSFKWPFVTANAPPVPSSELINRLHVLTEILIQIQLPETQLNSDSSTQLTLPVQLLVRPLKKRFTYHFSGARQTNQSDKPEWYFTQILNWLKDHLEFVERYFQPVYNHCCRKHTNVRMEFMMGLVQLTVDKLHQDLPQLQFDDALFSHTVDEALGFVMELRDGYGYPTSQPNGVLSVLTQAHFFIKWMNLEKKYSLEKLDAIMRSESAFQQSTILEDDDFTTECVDKFLTLLSTITDRYRYLAQPGHRLHFLQLQLELLDDFRVRLLQLLRAEEDEANAKTSSAKILNSISCLIFVLQEWNVIPHFLQLQYYRRQQEGVQQSEEEEGVFDDVIRLLTNMQEDIVNSLTDNLILEAKATSRPYRKDRWHVMDDPIEDGVTASSLNMFNVLTSGLCSLHKSLTPRLRTHALNRVAKALDCFLFEELIKQVYFSTSGAIRFSMDIRRGLVPLFAQYLTKPQASFPLLSDACSLLLLAPGSALLLKSALSDPQQQQPYMVSDLLTDVGVTTLNTSQVLLVLARRTDL